MRLLAGLFGWIACLVLGADLLRSLEAAGWDPLRLGPVLLRAVEIDVMADGGWRAWLGAMPLVAVPLALALLCALLARRQSGPRARRRRRWR
jgi:hypothetical protein